MPNLSAHLGMAKEAASRLEHPVIDRNLGAFLLGSVTPDIRIITKGKRDDTHFVDLDFHHMGDGLDGMFREHPRLADAGGLSEATAAFVVGYASHLLSDELWILGLYRPYFGNREVYEDAHEGDLMDRALQLELDRREQLASAAWRRSARTSRRRRRTWRLASSRRTRCASGASGSRGR